MPSADSGLSQYELGRNREATPSPLETPMHSPPESPEMDDYGDESFGSDSSMPPLAYPPHHSGGLQQSSHATSYPHSTSNNPYAYPSSQHSSSSSASSSSESSTHYQPQAQTLPQRSPFPVPSAAFLDALKPGPYPLRSGDVLYWHHLARNGEIPGVGDGNDTRARRGGCVGFDR